MSLDRRETRYRQLDVVRCTGVNPPGKLWRTVL